jgi:energy-coupling factor transporter ATP-binding protein EcfA2
MWYIRRDSGRPITIASHSELLDTILQMEYGLNLIEPDQNYTVAGLCAYARTVPATGKQESLSYFDADSKSLLIHMGRRDVLRVTADGIDKVVNGANGIVFPWQLSIEPFNYGAPDLDWAEHLFGESAGHDALQNLINLPREAAVAVLRVYMLFLLFRSIAISRPILACLGQPGSGKSTLFRKLYALLYGRNKGVSSVTTQEDFDQNVAADPFVALDGVDSPASWLPDRLSLSASVSDITKRKLYTNADTIILKRTGLVGITAHNPRFGREDIADRMLLLTFERLHRFIPEQIIIDYVLEHRSSLWGGIIHDAQVVLGTEIPHVDIQFRVEDFARIGTWISRALGCEAEFATAVETIRYGQRSFSLEEDAPLIAALKKVVDENEIVDWAPPQLWAKLEWAATDKAAFVKTYRSSTWLGKKLLVLQDALGLAFVTSWKQDPLTNNKIWTIRRREARVNGSGAASSTNNGAH